MIPLGWGVLPLSCRPKNPPAVAPGAAQQELQLECCGQGLSLCEASTCSHKQATVIPHPWPCCVSSTSLLPFTSAATGASGCIQPGGCSGAVLLVPLTECRHHAAHGPAAGRHADVQVCVCVCMSAADGSNLEQQQADTSMLWTAEAVNMFASMRLFGCMLCSVVLSKEAMFV